jgi:predicted flap endonuclease-1-like 5' DNA nuclease
MSNWLAFIIGVLVGLIIAWLIYLLFIRPRRAAEEADLRLKLDGANKESAALKAQLSGCKDLQVRLDNANGQVGALQEEVAKGADLQARLDSAGQEVNSLKAQLASLKDVQASLDACQAEAEQHKIEIERLNADLAAGQASASNLAAAAPATRGVEVEAAAPDDLQVIEGIGPVIAALLNKSGITTFAQLASTSVESLRSILDAGGSRFRIADPGTWPMQSLLAREGYTDALKALQNSLRAGRRV